DENSILYYGNKSILKKIFQQMILHAFSQTLEGYIAAKLVCKDNQVGFIIEDNGLGITSEDPITVTHQIKCGKEFCPKAETIGSPPLIFHNF
ncbi:MAG: hypothetical protein AAF497_16015, partial [Planctomycetota bacterium]